MSNPMWTEELEVMGIPVVVTSMITEQVGKRYRSIVTLNNGKVREALGDSAYNAEKNALFGLNVDWTHVIPTIE